MNKIDDFFHRADALEQSGQLQKAIIVLNQLLKIAPNSGAVHLKLSMLLDSDGKHSPALAHAQAALKLLPDSPEAHLLMGMLLVKANDVSNSVIHFNHASQLDPITGRSGANLLKELLKHSIEGWQETLKSKPDDFYCLQSLGKAKYLEGSPEESRDLLLKALALRPGEPHTQYNLAFAELQLADFQSGWTHYESRFDTGEKEFPKRLFTQPKWTTEELSHSSLLVHSEQGLGDVIQFSRYLTLLQPYARQVIFECPGPLFSLVSTSFPKTTVIPAGAAFPAYDFHIPLLSLPHRFGTSLATVPARVPYLHSVQTSAPKIASNDPERDFKIGIVWAGSPNLRNDLFRSMPLAEMNPLFDVNRATFYSLQTGPARMQIHALAGADQLIDLAPELTDFRQTAAIIQQLDLVISVDTATAHLAGALGKPVWILLPFAAEWRWLRNRTDSPWYPSARLFRQARPHDWAGAILAVREKLCATIQTVR